MAAQERLREGASWAQGREGAGVARVPGVTEAVKETSSMSSPARIQWLPAEIGNGLNSRRQPNCVASGGPREGSVALPLAASSGRLHFWACGPFLLQRGSLQPPFPRSRLLSLTLTALPPSYYNPCGHTEPAEIVRDSLSLCKALPCQVRLLVTGSGGENKCSFGGALSACPRGCWRWDRV